MQPHKSPTPSTHAGTVVPISKLQGVPVSVRWALKAKSISTATQLLAAAGGYEQRGALAVAMQVAPELLTAIVRRADLARVKGVGVRFAQMLNEIGQAIPRILAAALWIGIAFIAAKFLKTIIEAILPPTGFDDAIRSTGVLPATAFPSRIVANIAMIAIILAASIEAAKQLGGGTIAIFLAQVTELGGKVIFGTLIIVVGIFLARIVANLVGSGTGEGGFAQTIVRYAIIALFTAIGLTFMGLADQIVMLAFGLILGSAAIATAIAFGIGGRDAAGRILERWADAGTPSRPTPPKRIRQAPPSDEQPPLV